MTKKQRAALIIDALEKAYPDAECSLDFRRDPWQLMVSAILATQCTDKRVNMVTPALFDRYKTIWDFAKADEKAKNIAKRLIASEEYLENKIRSYL